MIRRGRRRDRGAVAALVAVLLAGNALLGMAALTVDVGLMYAEREELQSGADAAGIAVAKVCAANNKKCRAAIIAGDYAKANASDNFADAAVCGLIPISGPGSSSRVSACDPGASNLTACIGSPPADPAPYVEVRTSTRRSPTETALPPAFAGALIGTDGVTIGACSRVSWGPVLRTQAEVAMAISLCAFEGATANGVHFQPPPIGGHDDPDAELDSEVAIPWRAASDLGCTAGGNTFPDGFAWIPPDSGCTRAVQVGDWYDVTVAAGNPPGCADLIHEKHHALDPVTVAIFDDARAVPGGSPQTHVVGIAVFVITGWWIGPGWSGGPDHSHEPNLHQYHLCSGDNNFCLYGYFTTQLFRTGSGTGNMSGTLGTQHFGAIYLKTIG